jgi:hypothetical protein
VSASFVVSSQNSQPRSSCAGLFCSALQSFTFRAARNHERTVFHLSPDALKSISKSGRRFYSRSPKRGLRDGSKLIRQILGAVFDNAMTVAKLKGARDRVRRERGECEGRKSYGERE